MRTRDLFSVQFIYFSLMIFFLYLPIIVLIVFSFNDSSLMVFPLKGFTLNWYKEALENQQLMLTVRNSVFVGVISGAISTVLGTMGAIAIIRFNFPGKNIFTIVAGAPLIVPYVVLGVALLLFFHSIGIKLSLLTIGLAHIVVSVPVALIYVAARIVGFPSNLEEASMDLGANYWETLWRVTIPLIFPALIAAFLTCFTISFNEFAITNFVVGTKATLPIYMYSQLRITQRVPLIIAISSLIMVISISVLFLSERLRRVGQKPSKKDQI
jgi:spermidine/putrescine transport system permease protein